MGNKRILLIDDDLELCQELAEILRDEDYDVKNTSSPLEGKTLIDKDVFDIVILDFKMPDLNGLELLKIIKTKNPKTSVFFITGKPFIEKLLQEQNLADLVSGIISKPFNIKTLLDKISTS